MPAAHHESPGAILGQSVWDLWWTEWSWDRFFSGYLTLVDQKQLENVKCFKYLGSLLTNDGRCTREIKSRIDHGKSCIQQEEDSFYQQIGLKFEEETNKMLHLEHGFVWC